MMAGSQKQTAQTRDGADEAMISDQKRFKADARAEANAGLQQQALSVLSALGQETRLKAFRLLAVAGEDGIGAGLLAQELGTPHNTLSTHLAILTRAGLVSSERSGRNITYRIVPQSLGDLLVFLLDDCCNAVPKTCVPNELLQSLLPDTSHSDK